MVQFALQVLFKRRGSLIPLCRVWMKTLGNDVLQAFVDFGVVFPFYWQLAARCDCLLQFRRIVGNRRQIRKLAVKEFKHQHANAVDISLGR